MTTNKFEFQIIKDQESFNNLLNRLDKTEHLAFDIESTGLGIHTAKDWKILCFSFSFGKEDNYSIPYKHRENKFQTIEWYKDKVNKLFGKIKDKKIKLICHNSEFDILGIKREFGIELDAYYDTVLLAHLCYNMSLMSYSLGDIAKKFLNFEYKGMISEWMANNGIKKSDKDAWGKVPLSLLSEYNALDSYATFQLFNLFLDELKKDEIKWKFYHNFIIKNLRSFIKLVQTGIGIDKIYLDYITKKYYELTNDIYNEIFVTTKREVGEFNPSSRKDLSELLYKKMKFPREIAKQKVKTKYTTDEQAMTCLFALNPSVILTLLRYAKSTKYLSFLESILDAISEITPSIYPSYLLHGTKSGRVSCRDPGLHSIPAGKTGIKRCFIPRPVSLKVDKLYSKIKEKLGKPEILTSKDWNNKTKKMTEEHERNHLKGNSLPY